MSDDLTWEFDDDGIKRVVDWNWSKGCAASWDSPAEKPQVEDITFDPPLERSLTDEEEKEIIEAIDHKEFMDHFADGECYRRKGI